MVDGARGERELHIFTFHIFCTIFENFIFLNSKVIQILFSFSSSIFTDLTNAVEHVAVVYSHQLETVILHPQQMVANIVLDQESSIDPVTSKTVRQTRLIFVISNVPT